MTPEDRRHLSRAFDLARRGLGLTSPNPAVGAVIVRDGRIVGQGHHARAGAEHAEAVALGEAGEGARGADLYVNLEPCCSHRILVGRAAPCVDQIIAAGVSRVIAAARDPNPAIDGRGLERLRQLGVAVEPEDRLFARRAARLNEVFFKFIRSRAPFVVLKVAMTLDGRIALPSGESRWITDEASRSAARALRSRYDGVLVGVGTALADDPRLLPDAGTSGGPSQSRPPLRVVLDSRLRLRPASGLVGSAAEGPILVYASDEAPAGAERALEAKGVGVVRTGPGRVSLPRVLSDLGSREVTSLLVAGGTRTARSHCRPAWASVTSRRR